MKNSEVKILNDVKNKKQLEDLYLNQITRRVFVAEINDILRETRKSITEGMRQFAKNLHIKEVIIFIYRNGKPKGYTLSDELKELLQEYKDDQIREKFLLHELQKTKS